MYISSLLFQKLINRQIDTVWIYKNNKRIAREMLMLPTDEHRNPIYFFMEQYEKTYVAKVSTIFSV